MKFFFLTSQLQGLRIVDTLPWPFLFLGKFKKKFSRFDLFTVSIYLFFLIYALLISSDTLSVLKISTFLIFSLLASRLRLSGYSNLKISNFYIYILIGLIIEDIAIKNFGIFSPFVRDPDGAFFFFKERSFFVLLLFSIISFTRTLKLSHILVLYFIGIFTKSTLFWPLYLGLIIYKYSRIKYQNFVNFSLISFLSTFYLFIYNSKNLIYILNFKFIEYSDLLRFLINLTAINSKCLGTIFLQQCSPDSTFINLSREYFIEWQSLTGQSAFFILFTYFSYAGILLIIFMLFLMNKKLKYHKNKGLILFNIFIQMFIQGFLLSPLFFLVLSINEKERLKK